MCILVYICFFFHITHICKYLFNFKSLSRSKLSNSNYNFINTQRGQGHTSMLWAKVQNSGRLGLISQEGPCRDAVCCCPLLTVRHQRKSSWNVSWPRSGSAVFETGKKTKTTVRKREKKRNEERFFFNKQHFSNFEYKCWWVTDFVSAKISLIILLKNDASTFPHLFHKMRK